MTNLQTINRLRHVEKRIAQACQQHNQPPPLLLAVSKTRKANEIQNLIAAGVRDFGENYLQEALEKQQQLKDQNVNWHFIGPIQSNKSQY